MQCLAVVPARGGSRGVARKNVKSLAGKPLIVHTLEAAQQATRVTRVVVSTDDPEIGAVAKAAGVDVIWRPEAISGHQATSESAVLHALQFLAEQEQYVPDLVMLLQCTSPFTLPEDLDGAVETLVSQSADSCFTAVPFFHFVWAPGSNAEAVGVNHEGKKRKRRQDLPPQYLENGAVYVMRNQVFREEEERFCGKTVVHVVPEDRALEIDTPLDFATAEVHMRARHRQGFRPLLPATPGALVMDFDGVLSDNAVYVDQNGVEAVRCDRGDGLGLSMLKKTGLPLLILSKEQNPVVTRRAEKLGIECLQGIDEKRGALTAWAEARQIPMGDIIFVGNDVNDLPPLTAVGCPVCPADAVDEVRTTAKIVLTRPGGHGAIRELCDVLVDHLQAKTSPSQP